MPKSFQLHSKRSRNIYSLFSTLESMQYNGKITGTEFIKQKIYQHYQFTSAEKQYILRKLENNKNAFDATTLSENEKQHLKDLLNNKNLYMQWDTAWTPHTASLCQHKPERAQEIIRYCNEICQSSKQIQWNHKEEINPSYFSELSNWYSAQLKSKEIDPLYEDLFSATHLGHTLLIELLAKNKYKEFAQLLDEQNELALDCIMSLSWYVADLFQTISQDETFHHQEEMHTDENGPNHEPFHPDIEMLDALQNIFHHEIPNEIPAANNNLNHLNIGTIEILENPRYRYIFEIDLIENVTQHLKNKNVENFFKKIWEEFLTKQYSEVTKEIEKTYPQQKWMQNEYIAYCYLAAKLLELENNDLLEYTFQELATEYQFYFEKMRDLAAKGNKFASLEIAINYKDGVSIQGTNVIPADNQLAQQWLTIAVFQGDCFHIRDTSLTQLYLSKPIKNEINCYKFMVQNILKEQLESIDDAPITHMLYMVYQDIIIFIDWLVRNPNDIHHFQTKEGLMSWINIFLLDGPFVITRDSIHDAARINFLNKTVDIIWQVINFLKATPFEPQWQTLADIIHGKAIREKLFDYHEIVEQTKEQTKKRRCE